MEVKRKSLSSISAREFLSWMYAWTQLSNTVSQALDTVGREELKQFLANVRKQ